jgi:hypothetical protein
VVTTPATKTEQALELLVAMQEETETNQAKIKEKSEAI